MKRIISLVLVGFLGFNFSALAEEKIAEKDEHAQQLRAAFEQALPRIEIDSISPSPIKDIYEITFGAEVLYISADGRFLIQGDVFDLDNKMANLTEKKRALGRRVVMDKVDESRMIVFAPEPDKIKYTVTVFTDIDCGYCRRLHRQMASYNDAGIAIRYMLHPNAGLDSRSHQKLETVWCSEDRNLAMTEAKSGKSLEPLTCDNPVAEHLSIARELGVSATPTIVLSDGQVLPGYMPVDQLLGALK